MRDSLQCFFEDISDYINQNGNEPYEDSHAFKELSRWDEGKEILTAYSQGHLLLESSGDHLYALTRLLFEPIQTIAPWTCTRAVLESSAYGYWLLSDEITEKERVARSMAYRYEGLIQQRKMEQTIGDKERILKAKSRIEEIEKDAIGLGYELKKNNKGKTIGIALNMPSATECIRDYLNYEIEYRICSSIAHSYPASLIDLSFHSEDENNPTELSKNLSPNSAGWLLMIACEAFCKIVWARASLFWHDKEWLKKIYNKGYDAMGFDDSIPNRFWNNY